MTPGDADRISGFKCDCGFPLGKVVLDDNAKIWKEPVDLPGGGARFCFFCPKCRHAYAFELTAAELAANRVQFALEQNASKLIN